MTLLISGGLNSAFASSKTEPMEQVLSESLYDHLQYIPKEVHRCDSCCELKSESTHFTGAFFSKSTVRLNPFNWRFQRCRGIYSQGNQLRLLNDNLLLLFRCEATQKLRALQSNQNEKKPTPNRALTSFYKNTYTTQQQDPIQGLVLQQ